MAKIHQSTVFFTGSCVISSPLTIICVSTLFITFDRIIVAHLVSYFLFFSFILSSFTLEFYCFHIEIAYAKIFGRVDPRCQAICIFSDGASAILKAPWCSDSPLMDANSTLFLFLPKKISINFTFIPNNSNSKYVWFKFKLKTYLTECTYSIHIILWLPIT